MTPVLSRRRYGATNYAYLLAAGEDAALVDPGEAGVALALAEAAGVRPRWILHTHAHPDHVGGTREVAARLGAAVYGHPGDAGWFAPERELADGELLELGALRVRVHHAPGHTPGSVLLECGGHLLTGDTLFTGGCGNCRNGGDPAVLARSFHAVFPRLGGELRIEPGHDYAAANLPFVLELEPGNREAAARLAAVRAAAAAGREPAAATLAEERRVNPFLRTASPEAFVALRRRRDGWTAPPAGP